MRLLDADSGLAAALEGGDLLRWAGADLRPRVAVGPEASGELEIWVDLLPPSPATVARLEGLPVALEAGAMVVAGTRYAAGRRALATRIMRSMGATDGPDWLVVAADADAAGDLAEELVFRGLWPEPVRRRGREFDLLLRETRWLERRALLREVATHPGSWEIDPASERDDLAARDRFVAELVTLPGRHVALRVPPEAAARPEMATLAADLDRAAAAMARRVPVAVEPPISVVVERDFVGQARHAGAVGEAVRGARGEVGELHVVLHPEDSFAYRHALAAALLERARLAPRLPPWLARGAALWLSGDWYGRPWREWLPVLAAAGALPSAEELLAAVAQDDGSPPLWTPVAAAVVEALPGSTVTEKLAALPSRERVAAALAALGSLSPPRRAAAPPPPDGFLAGVSLAMSNRLEGGYHAPAFDRALDGLADLGADAVSLMPFAFQRQPSSPELGFVHDSPSGETDVGLVHAARRCRVRGVSVLWKPHVWASGGWAGEIAMASEADWQRWWSSYHRYVLHHAFLARWAGADLFSVGVELSRTLDREAEWRRLIAGVRLLFPGPLTYAGNWHGDLDRAPFWNDLDLVGVDAYFPLSSSPEASRRELVTGARGVAARLAAAARRHGKPVLLTEVGFAARRGAWIEPHTEGGELSLADQARAYEALFAGLGRPPWLAGAYVWKVFSGPRPGADATSDFGLAGRPAAAVVRVYYAGWTGATVRSPRRPAPPG